ncbi:MAG: alpha/beta hydrolase-fold protein [Arcanobacterium sp.]|nr:alpha/beta hydrolase-fold protein [Arcanobacterium sp.]MDY5588993.1 alpha/beta hydrolase-fold protein [Arcanobacterium sp.]
MAEQIRQIPLVGKIPLIIFIVLLALSLLTAVVVARHGVFRFLAAFGAASTLGLLIFLVMEVWWNPFPDSTPLQTYLLIYLALIPTFAVLTMRGQRWVYLGIALVAWLGSLGLLNQVFYLYPVIGSLNQEVAAEQMDYQTFVATKSAPRGAIVTLDWEATASGFPHRPAVAYVPPAYFSSDVKLPVLVLLAGNPGSPEDWFGVGDVPATLDAYQRAHHGLSPIVVSVDGTGSRTQNPMCVDGPLGKVNTWLAVDVPAGIAAHFRVNPDQSTWTIGGLSYGGTCSLQIVTNNPTAYGAFMNFSGQKEPTIGSHKATVKEFFGGSEKAFAEIDPAHLLSKNSYPKMQGVFVAGRADLASVSALKHLYKLSREAQIDASLKIIPGAHSFQVWREALKENLPLAARAIEEK